MPLMDAIAPLADHGTIWLMTPKAGRSGHVEAADIAEAAPVAGPTDQHHQRRGGLAGHPPRQPARQEIGHRDAPGVDVDRRRMTIATWRPPHEGVIHGVLTLDATAVLDYIERAREATGEKVTMTAFVGAAAGRHWH